MSGTVILSEGTEFNHVYTGGFEIHSPVCNAIWKK